MCPGRRGEWDWFSVIARTWVGALSSARLTTYGAGVRVRVNCGYRARVRVRVNCGYRARVRVRMNCGATCRS